VLGLFRQYWIPTEGESRGGLYVRFPADDLLRILALEAHRAGAFVVGEDLGTIAAGVRQRLAKEHILSCRLLYFEKRPPAAWPVNAVASVTTHDLPTVAGLWSRHDSEPATRERLRERAELDGAMGQAEVVERTHQALARAPCRLVVGQLDDALLVLDRPNRPGSTIVMSAEDDQDRTIVPRLVAGGADRMKIHFIDSVILADGSETLPSLRADIDAIKAAAAALGDCRLIVIDPVSAYLDGVDDNRNVALRGVLTPLSRLAEQLGAAVVLVSHLTKAGSNNGKHRVLGSIAYIGACRANHLFVADPDDPTGRRVLMVDNGSNIAPPASALAYTIEDRNRGSTIKWCQEPVTTTIGNSLKPAQSPQFHHEDCTMKRVARSKNARPTGRFLRRMHGQRDVSFEECT